MRLITLKLNFLENKTLAWTSQIVGIEELAKNESFLLCTPTGSGKTTIAELAIIQNLLSKNISDNSINDSIALYIVPKRALAAEVEFKLSKILTQNLNTNIQITSLYGGNDYGPDEISITEAIHPFVLICTQEKTDALIRLFGNEFLEKVKLVIIDAYGIIGLNSKDSANKGFLKLSPILFSPQMRLMVDLRRKYAQNEDLSAKRSAACNSGSTVSDVVPSRLLQRQSAEHTPDVDLHRSTIRYSKDVSLACAA